jgi:hypothetical protein
MRLYAATLKFWQSQNLTEFDFNVKNKKLFINYKL